MTSFCPVYSYQLIASDSQILKEMTCGDKKSAYIAAFGLGPLFEDYLRAKIRKAGKYVLMFDESLNQEMQKKQLDVLVRFWDDGQVRNTYCCILFRET